MIFYQGENDDSEMDDEMIAHKTKAKLENEEKDKLKFNLKLSIP
jgi:hypothetical protein